MSQHVRRMGQFMTAAANVKRLRPTFLLGGPILMDSGLKERCTEAWRRLTEAEGRRNISLAEIGRRVGSLMNHKPYGTKVVGRWLDAQREPENAVYLALARVFGVDPGWLVFGAECAAPMVPSREKLSEWAALSREIQPARATVQELASHHPAQGKAAAGSRRRSPPHPTSARKGPR